MLAGYLAASWSKTGKIGTYGGQQFPGVTRFMDGLYAGIQYYNEQKGTTVTLLGWDGRSRSDAAGTFVGGAVATTPGTTRPRASSSPRRSSTRAWTSSIRSPAPRATARSRPCPTPACGPSASTPTSTSASARRTTRALLTSAQKAIDVSVLDFFNQVEGGYLGGTDYSGTLANDGVLLAPYHDYDSQISAELKAEIEALRARLADGTRQGLHLPRARLLARTRQTNPR